jgi:hypothetical protein
MTMLCKKYLLLQNPKKWKPDDLIPRNRQIWQNILRLWLKKGSFNILHLHQDNHCVQNVTHKLKRNTRMILGILIHARYTPKNWKRS